MNRRPNVLFFFSDQHRGDWMPYDNATRKRQGTEELALEMPNIKGMMDRGVSFTEACTPAAICAPARACLAAGKRYRNCRVDTNKVNYDTALPSFYKELSDSGYFVTGVGKFDLNKADLDWGDGCHKTLQEMGFSKALDSEGKMDVVWATMQGTPGPYGRMLKEHGYLDAYMDDMSTRGNSPSPCPIPDELYADNWITERGCKLLSELPDDQPWFMQVNFSGPHDPWDITERMKKAMEDRNFPPAADCPFREANLEVRKNYAAMIENIDSNIGKLLEALSHRKDAENTLLIYASDHGEMMGDHGLYGKAKPYNGSVHIPIVIDASRIEGTIHGKCFSCPVELQDLANTILDYAGISRPDSLESISLRSILTGKKEKIRDYSISELINPNRKGLYTTFGTISDGDFKLILESGKQPRLFRISKDPFEMDDVSSLFPEKVKELENAFLDRGESFCPVSEEYAKAFNAV